MKKSIAPSYVKGTIYAPTSKSYLQRAIAAGLLASGVTTLENITHCDDSIAAMNVAKALGAKLTESNNGKNLHIEGGFAPTGDILHCGEAGLCSRMFTSIAALHTETLTLTGEGSLTKRPFHTIVSPLQQLGANCQTNDGKIPLRITGKLSGGFATIDGSLSSQFLTGLLMALPLVEQNTVLEVHRLKSKPYIDMTLDLLESFGIAVVHEKYEIFRIKGNQKYVAQTQKVEGDWSGASFLLVAAAINGDLVVKNLNPVSKQADRAILDALKAARADLEVSSSAIAVRKSTLEGFEFDATECPDLFPPLVALAAYCKGTTTLKGAERLTHKESDRSVALQTEFGKLGIQIKVTGDTMTVEGGAVCGGTVRSHHDHRIAMASAVAALGATEIVNIEESESVRKSYPMFFEDVTMLGASVV